MSNAYRAHSHRLLAATAFAILDIILACFGAIGLLYIGTNLDQLGLKEDQKSLLIWILAIGGVIAGIQILLAALALYALNTMRACLFMSFVIWQVNCLSVRKLCLITFDTAHVIGCSCCSYDFEHNWHVFFGYRFNNYTHTISAECHFGDIRGML